MSTSGPDQLGKLGKLKKLARFTSIYGPQRTAQKALGRLRVKAPRRKVQRDDLPRVAFIGCGQFAYATLAYFLRDKANITACMDVDARAAQTLADALPGCRVETSAAAIFADPRIATVFVASNHASHADYAVAAVRAGKDVYVEKPVAVTCAQLAQLSAAARSSSQHVWAGYNRPFSGAVRELKKAIAQPSGPLTLSCFVSGHVLPEEHWYRRPEEGTRICGNVGHWLDLAVHLLGWRGLPDRWRVSLLWSNPAQRDEDLAINLASDAGDLVNIVLTARTEPFEGIHEGINLQWGDTIAAIDDFRRLTIWQRDKLRHRRYWPKDVGHKGAIAQALGQATRAWQEVEDSTLLMLHVTEMVKTATAMTDFSFAQARAALTAAPAGSGHGGRARP